MPYLNWFWCLSTAQAQGKRLLPLRRRSFWTVGSCLGRTLSGPLWFLAALCDRCHPALFGLRLVEPKEPTPRRDCGDLHFGFARVKCEDCGHEYLLAFSCKRRHFCPSCHQKRVVEFGEWLCAEVLKYVPHRQWVFTFWPPMAAFTTIPPSWYAHRLIPVNLKSCFAMKCSKCSKPKAKSLISLSKIWWIGLRLVEP